MPKPPRRSSATTYPAPHRSPRGSRPTTQSSVQSRRSSAKPKRSGQPLDTSWQGVSRWYTKSVGQVGHYYHQQVVLPQALKLLNLQPDSRLLDLACGQGVLARHLPPTVTYYGLDLASDLIHAAQRHNRSSKHHFALADVTKPLPLPSSTFTHASIILALQNIQWPDRVFRQAADHLVEGGRLVMVLNHPSFRIPRQSSWGVDEAHKTQYRRVDRYISPLKIPITAHPGQQNSATTWSFHQPLSFYVQALRAHGFVIEALEEWVSDKTSQGAAAKMENRSRSEFPLFLAISARKLTVPEPGT